MLTLSAQQIERLFYFRTTEEIKIIRILHGSQDVKNKF